MIVNILVGLTILICFIEIFWQSHIIEIKSVSLHLKKSYLKSMMNMAQPNNRIFSYPLPILT